MEVKRQSIFASALRAFFSTLSGIIGVIVALFLVAMAIAVFSKSQKMGDKTECIILADAEGNRERLSDFSPAILRLNIHGIIGLKTLNAQTIESQLLDSRIGPLKNDRVKGILLHIDSPGGTVTDSYQIYSKLVDYKMKYKVPIYAYVNGMCASGGMMIACAADKIFSSPVGVIGSVGVKMGPVFNVAELMEKYGIKEKTFTKGKDKDMLSPFRNWVPEESRSIEDIMDYNYKMFLKIVADARPKITESELINQYGARVFNPDKSQEYGFVDAKSDYNQALSELVKAAGVNEKYQVFTLKFLSSGFSKFIDNQGVLFSGKIQHEIHIPTGVPSELMNRPLYLYLPAPSLCEP